MFEHLRKDIKLNQKRWHRLIKVIFRFAFIIIFFTSIFTIIKNSIFDNEVVYEYKWLLKDRLSEGKYGLQDFLEPWETLISHDYKYWYRIFGMFYVWKGKYDSLDKKQIESNEQVIDDYYCSSDIAKDIKDVANYFSISDVQLYNWNRIWNRVNINSYDWYNKIVDYIKSNNLKCICVDWYWGKKQFINLWPLSRDFSEEASIYVKRWDLTTISIITEILWHSLSILIIYAIIWFILIIIYYKIILYVVYWNRKIK
jgi:hypothetical protein